MSSSPSQKSALVLFLVLSLTLGLAQTLLQVRRGGVDIIDSDGVGYFAHLPSILLDADIDYSDDFARFGRESRNHWPIGTAIVWSPFYLAGHAVSRIGGFAHSEDGSGFPEQFACVIASVLAGCAAVALSYKTCRLYFDHRESLLAVLGLLGGSNLLYYLLAEPYMSHAASAFLTSLFVYLTLSEPLVTSRRAVLLGLLAGLMALTRPQDGLFVILPFVLAILSRQKVRTLVVPLLVTAICSMAVFFPQILIWKSNTEVGQAVVPGGTHHWFPPPVWSVFFDPYAGLFPWHPITALAVLGLLLAAFEKSKPCLMATIGLFIQVLVVSVWGGQGQSFGARMLICCFPLFSLGLAFLAQRYGRFKGFLFLTTVLLTFLNLWLIVAYRAQFSLNPRPSIDALFWRPTPITSAGSLERLSIKDSGLISGATVSFLRTNR